MKRWVKASADLGEDKVDKLLSYAADKVREQCKLRDNDEYVDDLRWGRNGFAFDIYKTIAPPDLEKGRGPLEEVVTTFSFNYDENDDDSPKEQLDRKLNRFLNELITYEEYDTEEDWFTVLYDDDSDVFIAQGDTESFEAPTMRELADKLNKYAAQPVKDQVKFEVSDGIDYDLEKEKDPYEDYGDFVIYRYFEW